MHNLHDRHRSGAERSGQDAPLGQENRHDYQVQKEEGYPEDFSGITLLLLQDGVADLELAEVFDELVGDGHAEFP